jgi:hypothetical protein
MAFQKGVQAFRHHPVHPGMGKPFFHGGQKRQRMNDIPERTGFDDQNFING